MAIKISGTTVIDDSFNIRNVGVATATTFVGNLTGTATTTLSIEPSVYATTTQMVGLGTTASATIGFSTITVVSSTGIVVGDTVVGPGISVGTKVSGIAGTSVTLDTPVIVGIGTTSGSATQVSFYSSTKVINPGIAGPGTAKAWVTYEGGISEGVFPGGATTVSRAASSTTATFTTTNNHGLIIGNYVYVKTGVVAKLYLVTGVAGPKTFTITTVESTLISAGTVATFFVYKIYNSFNVGTVTSETGVIRSQSGIFVNFASKMPSAFYCPLVFGLNNMYAGIHRDYPKTSANFALTWYNPNGGVGPGSGEYDGQHSVVVFG